MRFCIGSHTFVPIKLDVRNKPQFHTVQEASEIIFFGRSMKVGRCHRTCFMRSDRHSS